MPMLRETTMRDVPVGNVIAISNESTGETRAMMRMDDDEFDIATSGRVEELEEGYVVYLDVISNSIILIPGNQPAWLQVDNVDLMLMEMEVDNG